MIRFFILILALLCFLSCAINDGGEKNTTTTTTIDSSITTTTKGATSTTTTSVSTTTTLSGYQFKVLYDNTNDRLKDPTSDSPRSLYEQVNYDDVDKFIRELESINILSERADYVKNNFDNLIKDKNFPAIKDGNVIFIYKGAKETDKIYIAGDMTQWAKSISLGIIQGTDIAYVRKNYPEDARLDYGFVVNSEWVLDPLNGNRCSGGVGTNGELIMNKYLDRVEHKYDASIPHGTIQAKKMKTLLTELIDPNYTPSKTLTTERVRDIWIYLPRDYDKSKNYHYVYCNDGYDYIKYGKMINTLDYMISKSQIPPVIAIFIDTVQGVPVYYPEDTNFRNTEIVGTSCETFKSHLINEIIPTVESYYSESKVASGRTLLGDSLAALFAMNMALKSDGIFNNILMQSGSSGEKVDSYYNCKFYFAIGTYCPAYDRMTANFDKFTDNCKGIEKIVSPQGHSWGFWRDTIASGLLYLLKE